MSYIVLYYYNDRDLDNYSRTESKYEICNSLESALDLRRDILEDMRKHDLPDPYGTFGYGYEYRSGPEVYELGYGPIEDKNYIIKKALI